MAIKLNHTIVPAKDKDAAARMFAKLFGLGYHGPKGHFAPVKVNEDLTMDFDDAESFEPHHYAFQVSEDEFDAIFARIQEVGLEWGSGPRNSADRQLNTRKGGRGVYFQVLDGHLLELLTRP